MLCESEPAGHAELVGVVAAGVLHGDAVFVGLAGKAALNVVNAADVWRKDRADR